MFAGADKASGAYSAARASERRKKKTIFKYNSRTKECRVPEMSKVLNKIHQGISFNIYMTMLSSFVLLTKSGRSKRCQESKKTTVLQA
jgi:hypothetical protein